MDNCIIVCHQIRINACKYLLLVAYALCHNGRNHIRSAMEGQVISVGPGDAAICQRLLNQAAVLICQLFT